MSAFWTSVLTFWYLMALLLVGVLPLVVAVAVAAFINEWLTERNRKAGR